MFLAGVDNVLADRISRMSVLSNAYEVGYLLSGVPSMMLLCENHMSKDAFLYLQVQWTEALHNYN